VSAQPSTVGGNLGTLVPADEASAAGEAGRRPIEEDGGDREFEIESSGSHPTKMVGARLRRQQAARGESRPGCGLAMQASTRSASTRDGGPLARESVRFKMTLPERQSSASCIPCSHGRWRSPRRRPQQHDPRPALRVRSTSAGSALTSRVLYLAPWSTSVGSMPRLSDDLQVASTKPLASPRGIAGCLATQS